MDVDPLALAATRINADDNGVSLTVLCHDLAGGAPDVMSDVDVVVTGDAFYSRAVAGALMPVLTRAADAGTLVLVGDPGRAYLPAAGLDPLAQYDVPVPADLEGSPSVPRPCTGWARQATSARRSRPAHPACSGSARTLGR